MQDLNALHQKACSGRGWQECATKNYFFPVAQFTNSISLFETHLGYLTNQANLLALEIGSDFGMSPCWLLDKILTHPSARLIYLDHHLNKYLVENISKTGAENKVTLLEKNITQHLASLKPLTIGLANLQYRLRKWRYVKANTALVWRAMKVGGIMVFAGYGWQSPDDPEQNIKKGVDLFLQSVEGKWEIVAHYPRAFKFMIRKIAKSEDEKC